MPNAIMSISQYNKNCIFFCDPIKNNIMLNGEFIRIVYSTKHVTMNSIYLNLPFYIKGVCKYYNKCRYDIELTSDIEQIKTVEMDIIAMINVNGKIPQYSIYDNLVKGCVKTICEFNDEPKSLILKMSGIWETDTECGITYKFIATV